MTARPVLQLTANCRTLSSRNGDPISSIIRGWINYYSHFYKSALYPSLRKIDDRLVAWTRRKFKRFRQRPKAAWTWLARTIRKTPELFPHWRLRYAQPVAGSRMSREAHVRYWERAGLKFLRATRYHDASASSAIS